MRMFIISALVSFGIIICSEQIPAGMSENPILFQGGTVHTISNGTFNADLLVDDGKISAIGTNLSESAEYDVIDAAGMHLYPGLISSGTTMGLTEIGSVRATRDQSESGNINPNVHVEVAYNADSETIPVTRSNGVLLAHVVPQGGLVSGTSAIMKLDGWTWEECIFQNNTGVVIQWPGMSKSKQSRGYGDKKKTKKSAREKIADLDVMMDEARAYQLAKDAGTAQGVDARLEALIPVLAGNIPFFINAQRQSEIEAAVYWSFKHNVKMILVGGADAWRIPELLKENNIPVIYQQPYSQPLRRDESYDQRYRTPALLHEAGIQFCINGSTTYSNQRNLAYAAGIAVAFGLPEEIAMRSVTLSTAEILGIEKTTGSLEVGKDATLIVTDGDPLQIQTNVFHAMIQGRILDLGDHHKSMYAKFRERYIQAGTLDPKN